MDTELNGLTEEQKTVIATCELLETKIIPELDKLVAYALDKLPCRQFQCMKMDTESLVKHLNDLKTNGPKKPFADIPLEESEIKDAEVHALKIADPVVTDED